jgi:two-component system cell cycle response regulator
MRFIQRHVYSPYVPWRLLGGLVLFALAFIVYYLTQIAPVGMSTYTGTHRYIAGVIVSVIGILYATGLGLLCFRGLHLSIFRPALSLQRNRQRFSPLLLGASLLCYALSQFVWLCTMLMLKQLPTFPSLEHWTELGMYPLLFGAILLLPTPNLALWERLRIFLDALMIMAAVTTLCYYFLLAPLLVKGEGTLLAKSVSGIFLAGDLTLMFCLLLVALRSGQPSLRPVLIMLFLASLLFFSIHIVHTYEVFYMKFNEFSRANVGLSLAGTLVVGAAQTITRSINAATPQSKRAEQANGTVTTSRWKAVLPSVLVLIFSLLIFPIWVDRGDQMFPGQIVIVYAGGFVVLILMVIRQLLTLLQINFLRQQLQTKNRALHLLNMQLEQQAITDPLTGLPNHRALMEKLDLALARAQATHGSCSLIFIDIDHFKTLNDRYGHVVGDQILCQFGKLVQESLPPEACVGRWGGEEFVALLPHSDSLEALNVAERIRARVDQRILAGQGEINVTCSLGVASYPQDASTRASLLMSADKAMYAAKRLGRNQVRLAHEPLVLALGMSEAEPASSGSEETEMLAVVDALMAVLEMRDEYTSRHARRVAALSLKLALMLGLSGTEAYVVSLGGLLHDLGKIGVPDEILLKESGLTEDEYTCMAQHPLTGAEIVAQVPHLQTVAAIVRSHHEHMDGSGYPDGLRGEEIPLGARIVAVADAYDALTSNRSYRTGCTPIEAIRELLRGAGAQFDPQVVGTLVRLFSAVPHLSEVKVA